MVAVYQVNQGLWSATDDVLKSNYIFVCVCEFLFLCLHLCIYAHVCVCVAEGKGNTGHIYVPEIIRAMTELFFVVENLAEVRAPSLHVTLVCFVFLTTLL